MIDIAEVKTAEGKLYLIVAIDRAFKFTDAALHLQMTQTLAAALLRQLIQILPYKIHTGLTDKGIQLTNRKQDRYAFAPIFDRVCVQNKIEHCLTKVHHPWTNGRVECMNQTLKESPVRRYNYSIHEQLKEHLYNFLNASLLSG